MNHQTRDLLERLTAFPLSESGEIGGFAARLADESGWTLGFSKQVTAEYLRFIVLTQVAGQMVCPSNEVDQAWHLHITRTTSYRAMCDTVLGSFLDHHASLGGAQELDKHRRMYAQTLAKYREVFEETPPADIWPTVDLRFQVEWQARPVAQPHTVNIHTTFTLLLIFWGFFVVAAISSVPVLSRTVWSAIDGPSFLVMYGIALAAICLLPYLGIRGVKVRAKDQRLDPYEVAYLAAGSVRVLVTAVTRLVAAGALVLQPMRKGHRMNEPVCEKPQHIADSVIVRLHPIESEVLFALPAGRVRADDIHILGAQIAGPVYHRLVKAGLALREDQMLLLRAVAIALLLALFSVGISRMIYGMQHRHAVFFLGTALFATLCLAQIFWKKKTALSPLGTEVMKKMTEKHARLKTDASTLEATITADGSHVAPWLTLGLALFGTQAAMASANLAYIHRIFGANTTQVTGSLQNGTGCSGGGSCGGGGGCGGGCGG